MKSFALKFLDISHFIDKKYITIPLFIVFFLALFLSNAFSLAESLKFTAFYLFFYKAICLFFRYNFLNVDNINIQDIKGREYYSIDTKTFYTQFIVYGFLLLFVIGALMLFSYLVNDFNLTYTEIFN